MLKLTNKENHFKNIAIQNKLLNYLKYRNCLKLTEK